MKKLKKKKKNYYFYYTTRKFFIIDILNIRYAQCKIDFLKNTIISIIISPFKKNGTNKKFGINEIYK